MNEFVERRSIMDKLFTPSISIEKFAAYLDENLSDSEMHKIDLLIASNSKFGEISEMADIIDEESNLLNEDDFTMIDDMSALEDKDFEIPELELSNIDNENLFFHEDDDFASEDKQTHDTKSLNDLEDSVDDNDNDDDKQRDWRIHDGDYGFWELGLPPIITEESIINIKDTTSMAEKRTYGYEPNNKLDTFDPNIWQGNQPTCAIRSQEIILRDYGIYHTQEELVEFAKQNGWFDPDLETGGTDKYAVGNILDACGIPTKRVDDATIYDVISELKAGHRVIVSVDANELWVKKEPNLFKRLAAQVTNKANDKIQDFLGLEGANHALVVAGVNVNPKDPSDISVILIDSGTGDVCIEYSFKEFYNAWSDGHCRMISTEIPAPFQYNYHTHQIEPSNINTDYAPSMAVMPDGLSNHFYRSSSYFSDFEDYHATYDNDTNPIYVEDIEDDYDSSSSQDEELGQDEPIISDPYSVDNEEEVQTGIPQSDEVLSEEYHQPAEIESINTETEQDDPTDYSAENGTNVEEEGGF